jgi:O-antigen/teichoic acid export membrane protein
VGIVSVNLKAQVLKGGAYLMARQTASMAIGLGGMIALTRLIGPANYGLAAGAVGIVFVLGRIGRFGIDTFLVRREEDPSEETYAQALVLLLLLGVAAAATGFLALPLLDRWFGDERFIPPLRAALLATWTTGRSHLRSLPDRSPITPWRSPSRWPSTRGTGPRSPGSGHSSS